jgi:putative transposase
MPAVMPYTRLRYHITTATHRRRPLITPAIERVLYPALRRGARHVGGHLLAVGGVEDHVHLVLALRPAVAVADAVRVMKTASSHAVRQQGAPHFRWQTGYAAFTVAAYEMDALLAYVARQKHHHAADALKPIYERGLDA